MNGDPPLRRSPTAPPLMGRQETGGGGPVDDATLLRRYVEERSEPAFTELVHRLLRFFEGRAFAEIGAALHVTEDAARMRVDRALDKLHALLAKRAVTSTSGALAAALANQALATAPSGLFATITGAALTQAAGAKENNVRFLDPEHPNVWPTLYYRIESEPRPLSGAEIDQWLREEAAKKAASRLRSGLINYTNGDLVACTIGDRPALSWTATFAFHGTNPNSTTPRGDALEEHLTLIYSPNCIVLFFVQATKNDLAVMQPKIDKMIRSTVLP